EASRLEKAACISCNTMRRYARQVDKMRHRSGDESRLSQGSEAERRINVIPWSRRVAGQAWHMSCLVHESLRKSGPDGGVRPHARKMWLRVHSEEDRPIAGQGHL